MRLIYHPSVFVIASTVLEMEGLDDWVHDEDQMLTAAATEGSPLNNLIKNVRDYSLEHMDALVELAGRSCYRSWESGRSSLEYIDNVLEQRHGSVFEHSYITFRISGVSRTLTHELVRHRVGVAISQESQRYVDASDINFVVPPLLCDLIRKNEFNRDWFITECQRDLKEYRDWQEVAKGVAEASGLTGTMAQKRANEAARWKLPGAAETRLVWTVNLRALRHFLDMRGGEAADMEIQRLAVELFQTAINLAPLSLGDTTQSLTDGTLLMDHRGV